MWPLQHRPFLSWALWYTTEVHLRSSDPFYMNHEEANPVLALSWKEADLESAKGVSPPGQPQRGTPGASPSPPPRRRAPLCAATPAALGLPRTSPQSLPCCSLPGTIPAHVHLHTLRMGNNHHAFAPDITRGFHAAHCQKQGVRRVPQGLQC